MVDFSEKQKIVGIIAFRFSIKNPRPLLQDLFQYSIFYIRNTKKRLLA